MPPRAVVRAWMREDEAFAEAVADAREAGFDAIAMEALAIADDADAAGKGDSITRVKLRVDLRLKLLSKWDPHRYGIRAGQAEEIATGTAREEWTFTPEMETRIREAVAAVRRVAPPGSFREEKSMSGESGEGA